MSNDALRFIEKPLSDFHAWKMQHSKKGVQNSQEWAEVWRKKQLGLLASEVARRHQ